MPVPQRQLLPAVLPENEAGCSAHKRLQTQDKRWLSHLQTAHCSVLLPCQTLPGEQVPCSILSEHKAKASAATAAAQTPAGPDVEKEDGDHAEGGAANWRAARRTCGGTSIARKQWHHSTQYPNVRWNPTSNSSDPNSDHASSSTARRRSWKCSTAAARRDSSSTSPSSVPAGDGWRWWGGRNYELSPTSTADAPSGPTAATKWTRG